MAKMTTLDLVHEKSEEIRQIAAKHGVLSIRLFGSVARDEAKPESDIDFLVEVGPDTSPWFPAGLMVDLEDILGRRIEVVVERALNDRIRDRVLQEAVPI